MNWLAAPLKTPVWMWPSVLSLDAPLVALVWQDFVCRSFPSTLLPAGRWMLGLSVWGIYLFDRLIDARRRTRASASPRTSFYSEHRRIVTGLLAAIVMAGAFIAAAGLRRQVFAGGVIAGIAVLGYLGAFAVTGLSGLSKRLAAALIFTVGVFLVAGVEVPLARLLWPALSFFGLCFGNLALNTAWEGRMNTLPVCVSLLGLGLLCLLAARSPWYAAVSSSSIMMSALGLLGNALSKDLRKALSDAALLTPLFLLRGW
ncbi:MAG: hypothetical protein IT168_03400 [Bryobacterales bacterium]|nr:hypothetical protein [Bryobacterales bacterium]